MKQPKQDTTSAGKQSQSYGADGSAITSPFNYSVDEEAEREKAMRRASEKIPNNPERPVL